jgi:type II secretory pathway pseudopilin PulG
MKNIMAAFALLFALAAFGFPPAGASADSAQNAQNAYDAFLQTATQIESQLYAKQAELNSLVANNQGTSPRVQELFKEIGELRGKLFTARAELDKTINPSGNSAFAGPGACWGQGGGGCFGGGPGMMGMGRGFRSSCRGW